MYYSFADPELVRLLHSGDAAAFSAIYDRYWEPMLLKAAKITRSKEEGADIVHEIFVSLWQRRETLTIDTSLAAYLFKSVRNLSIRYIEKNISRSDYLQKLSLHLKPHDSGSLEQYEQKELEKQISEAVAKLPPKMQEVFLLSRNENCSHREIAARLGIAETTVKKQVNNALKIIRNSLGDSSMAALMFWLLTR